MRTYIKLNYKEHPLMNVSVIKLTSSFNSLSDVLKFVGSLKDINIESVEIKYNKDLFDIDLSNGGFPIQYKLDLFDFEKEFE